MGFFLGTQSTPVGGGASEATTKEINGYNYSNVITSPKSNLFPISIMPTLQAYTTGVRVDDSNWSNFTNPLLGGYTGPTTWTANTDVTITSITNASSGGFIHWIKTPATQYNHTLITLKITLDGTTHTFVAKSSGGSQCIMAGAPYADAGRAMGFNTNYLNHESTHPDVFPNNNRVYYLSPQIARHQWFGKLYFENSCSIVFNMQDYNSNAVYRTSGAGITLL